MLRDDLAFPASTETDEILDYSNPDPGRLSPVLSEISEVIGLPGALILARFKGGTRISIPSTLKADHWLVLLLGPERAGAMVDHFAFYAARSLDIPHGPFGTRSDRWHHMHAMITDGATISDIARAMGCSSRTVYRHKSTLRKEGVIV